MKLSKTLLASLTPVATISLVAPVVVSCGKTYVIDFGDSVNCLSSNDPYQKIAKYHKRSQVYDASKNNCPSAPVGTRVVLEGDVKNNINKIRTISEMYYDLICSLYKDKKVFCIESVWDEANQEFTTFNLSYQLLNDEDKPEGEIYKLAFPNMKLENVYYTAGEVSTPDEDKVFITLNTSTPWSIRSHSYMDATIGE